MDTNKFLVLYNFCLTFAKQQIEANGGFYPFGADIDKDGHIEPAASGPHENPTTQEQMFVDLNNLFFVRAAHREIQAAAIATWETPTPLSQRYAIKIVIETNTPEAITTRIPLTRNDEGTFLEEPLSEPHEPRWFLK